MRASILGSVAVLLGITFACESEPNPPGTGEAGTSGSATGGGSGSANGGSSGSGAAAGGAGAGGSAGSINPGDAGSSGASEEGGAGGSDSGGASGAGEAGSAGTSAITLQVVVTGLPAGVSAAISVAGPSFQSVVVGSVVLAGLTPGNYAVAVPPLRVHGAIVDSTFDAQVDGSPAVVEPGVTPTITVSYARRPGTGELWITHDHGHGASALDAASLTTPPTTPFGFTTGGFSTEATIGPSADPTVALAFAPNSNDVWLGTCSPDAGAGLPQVIAKYTAESLRQTGTPLLPQVVITLPSANIGYACVSTLTFDPMGNLWVGTQRGYLLRFDASQLGSTGTPTPALTILGHYGGISAIAFDSSGNLFLDPAGGSHDAPPPIVRLSAAQLTADNADIVPDVVLELPAGAEGVAGIALDAHGNLWASAIGPTSLAGALMKFDAATLGTSGTLTPAVTIADSDHGSGGPLHFDNSGQLWQMTYVVAPPAPSTQYLYAYSASQLGQSGSPQPAQKVAVSDFGGLGWGFVFDQ